MKNKKRRFWWQKKKEYRRATEHKRISYGRRIEYNWIDIEQFNKGLGITCALCYVDDNGYLRWKANNHLCHRDIAYQYIYKRLYSLGKISFRFRDYDVHHKDGNKFNNNPDNLEVLSREQHKIVHGQIIFENGIKYIRLIKANVPRKQTKKAILIGGKFGNWYPKNQLIVRNGYIYASEWILTKKGGK